MRKTLLTLSAFLVLGIPGFPQQPGGPAATPQSKESTQHHRAKSVSVTGTVKSFEPGKNIEIDAKGVPHNYDLSASDTKFTISPDVKVGSQVKLTEKTDAAGMKTVVVKPSGKSGKPMSEKPPTQ